MHIKQTHIDPLMQELSLYKRWRYGKRSERLTPRRQAFWKRRWMPTWRLSKRKPTRCTRRYPPSLRRMRLPVELPRTDIHHEPESTTCRCGLKRIGEDVSGKLDYLPGVFTVERHIRGKWVCERCETLT